MTLSVNNLTAPSATPSLLSSYGPLATQVDPNANPAAAPPAAPTTATPPLPTPPTNIPNVRLMDPSSTGLTDTAIKPPTPDPNVPGTPTISDGAGGTVPVPPAPAPYLPPNASPVPTAPFTADSNLIGQTVLPTVDPRVTSLNGMTDDLLSQITNGPDRYKMAQDKFNTFSDATSGAFSHALQDATNAGATYGQLGSGTLTNKYGDLEQQREQQLIAERSGLFQDALSGSISDRLNNLGAVQGAESTAFNQDASTRDETRTERGYQNQQALEALAARIQQRQLEDQEQATGFSQAATSYGLGEYTDPASAELTAAGQQLGDSQNSAASIGQLISELLRQQSLGQVPAGV